MSCWNPDWFIHNTSFNLYNHSDIDWMDLVTCVFGTFQWLLTVLEQIARLIKPTLVWFLPPSPGWSLITLPQHHCTVHFKTLQCSPSRECHPKYLPACNSDFSVNVISSEGLSLTIQSKVVVQTLSHHPMLTLLIELITHWYFLIDFYVYKISHSPSHSFLECKFPENWLLTFVDVE